ncbi:unnamed protein product, partial [Didymodactylos carnosus]
VKWVSGAPNCTVVAGGNGAGSSLTQLHNPIGITVDTTTGNLYVADSANHRVQRWSPGAWQGVTVAGQSGVPGTGSNQFNTPRAVQLDRQGYLYILDYANTRIQRWAPNAVYGVTILATTSGKGTNQWTYPYSMKTDQLGNLYVVDAYTNRVQKYTLSCGPTTTTTTLAPLSSILLKKFSSQITNKVIELCRKENDEIKLKHYFIEKIEDNKWRIGQKDEEKNHFITSSIIYGDSCKDLLFCDCRFYLQNQLPCRHTIVLLNKINDHMYDQIYEIQQIISLHKRWLKNPVNYYLNEIDDYNNIQSYDS